MGENSREWRLEELRKHCDEDPSAFQPRVHTATISYNKMPSTFHPHADGYLPRRARGELSQAATDIFDGTRETRELFDHHHRGGGYDGNDYGRWKFE